MPFVTISLKYCLAAMGFAKGGTDPAAVVVK